MTPGALTPTCRDRKTEERESFQMKDFTFGAVSGGAIFCMLGGLLLLVRTDHVRTGEVLTSLGVILLFLALWGAMNPNRNKG